MRRVAMGGVSGGLEASKVSKQEKDSTRRHRGTEKQSKRERGGLLLAALIGDRAFPRAGEDGCGGKYVELALLGKGFP